MKLTPLADNVLLKHMEAETVHKLWNAVQAITIENA